MNLEDDLRAAGERLRERQEKARAELDAERAESERLREKHAREFWDAVGRRKARILTWPKREAK